MGWRSYKSGAPDIEPVTLTEVKAHLRIDTADDDDVIDGYILAARIILEKLTRRAFITQIVTLKLNAFPSGGKSIQLLRPPAKEVTSIYYINTDGVSTQWVEADNWSLDNQMEPAEICPDYDVDYPDARVQHSAVTIIYKAGYGDLVTEVPEDIRLAIKLLVGIYYENREATSVVKLHQMPMGLQSIIEMNRMPEVF